MDIAWNADWVGTEQARNFKIEGERRKVLAPWRIMPNWADKGLKPQHRHVRTGAVAPRLVAQDGLRRSSARFVRLPHAERDKRDLRFSVVARPTRRNGS